MKSYKSTCKIDNQLDTFLEDFHELGWEVFETRKEGVSDDGNYKEKVELYLGHEKENAEIPESYLKGLENLANALQRAYGGDS